MPSPFLDRRSEVVAALPGAASSAMMQHAPKAPSVVPIVVGAVVFLVAFWWALAGWNTEFLAPDLAPGIDIASTEERIEVPFPSEVDGRVRVYVEERQGRRTYEVLDGSEEVGRRFGEPQAAQGYVPVVAADVVDDRSLVLVLPSPFTGRVAFVEMADPPTRSDTRDMVLGAVVALVASAVALVWVLRRLRWRREVERYMEGMRAAGYVVD